MPTPAPPTIETARCRDCGYALRALAEPRCPECGTTFDPSDARTWLQPSLMARLRTVPFAQISRPMRRVLVGFLLAWAWGVLWLPGGFLITWIGIGVTLVAVVAELSVGIYRAVRGRVLPNGWSPVASRRRWVATVVAATLLFLHATSLGPQVTLLFCRWHVDPIVWKAWAVDPAVNSRVDSRVRFFGPFLAKMDVKLRGANLRVLGAGTLTFNDDDGWLVSWKARPHANAPIELLRDLTGWF